MFNPTKVGDQLILVGQKQIEAGRSCQSSAGQVRQLGGALSARGKIMTTLGSVQKGCLSVRSLLAPVVAALQFIRTTLNSIRIPTVTPTKQTLTIVTVKFTFVSGISIGSSAPFAGIAAQVEAIRTNLSAVRDTMQSIADALESLRTEMPRIQTGILESADDMEAAGGSMVDGGTAMQQAGALLKT